MHWVLLIGLLMLSLSVDGSAGDFTLPGDLIHGRHVADKATVIALSATTTLLTCTHGDIYLVAATRATITVTLPPGSRGTQGDQCSVCLVATSLRGGLIVAANQNDTLNNAGANSSTFLTSVGMGVAVTLETASNWVTTTTLGEDCEWERYAQ